MTAAPTRSPVLRWLKRIGLGLVGLLVLAVTVGAGYEALARRRAAREHPPAGTLVDIGGRRIHLDCRGTGAPTVVFEAGLDINGSLSWTTVHDSIAAGTRACAYDRAGVMWSDPKDGPQNAVTVAEDLHATLAAAGEAGPFVLVGHSLGGPYIMTYTKKYGDQVAGLVFVDASHPEQETRFAEVIKKPMTPSTAGIKAAAALAWTGLIRVALPAEGAPNVPDMVTKKMNAYASTSLPGMLAESDALGATLAEAGTFRTLGDRPLVVLTAMAPLPDAALKTLDLSKEDGDRFQAVWKTLHEEEASWSTRSRHQLVPDASHYIQFDRPDLVIAAVREVVELVRQGPK